jgi:hypothetical protein
MCFSIHLKCSGLEPPTLWKGNLWEEGIEDILQEKNITGDIMNII